MSEVGKRVGILLPQIRELIVGHKQQSITDFADGVCEIAHDSKKSDTVWPIETETSGLDQGAGPMSYLRLCHKARLVIIDRLHRQLVQTYESYLCADQHACLAAPENLHAKYAVTAEDIERQRDAAAPKLKDFLGELGYA